MGNCMSSSRAEEESPHDGKDGKPKSAAPGEVIETTEVEAIKTQQSGKVEVQVQVQKSLISAQVLSNGPTEGKATDREEQGREDSQKAAAVDAPIDKSPIKAKMRSTAALSMAAAAGGGGGAAGGGGNPVNMERQDSPFYVIRKTKDVRIDYNIGEELGHGQFGVVSVAVDKRTKKRYAVKSISKRKAESDPNFRKDIRTEVEIMYHLGGHSNIIQLYDVYEDADTIHLILELCEGGDWFQRLLAHGTYSEVMAAATTRAILETLAYCHSLGVVHRDIKPENVLLADRTPHTAIKLADFGLSAMVPTAAMMDPDSKAGNPKALLYDAVGTAYYVAPEVLMARVYGKEVDIWSLGVVLYIVLGGYAPFDGASEQQILNAIVYQPLRFDDPTWNEISNSAKDLISRMLTKDPRKRATISELLEHPWLNMVKTNTSPTKSRRTSNLVPDAVVTRLQQFAAMNRFKKEARKVLANFLPEEEVIGLLKIFKEMDTNNDGVLALSELRDALSGKGIKIAETSAKALLNRVDINYDDVIDYEEFLAATVHQLRLDKDELLYKAFQRFDRHNTGFISREDLQQALQHVQGGKLDVDAIIKAVDTDCDGRINYEEFCNYLCETDGFDEELDELPSKKRSLSRGNSSAHSSAGPRPLLNSISSRRRDTATSRNSRSSRSTLTRPDRTSGKDLKPTRSVLRRHESTSDPGDKDVGNKSVRFRETPEVSSYSMTLPRESQSNRRSQLEPLAQRSNSGSGLVVMGSKAPWELDVLLGGVIKESVSNIRASMNQSLRSSIRRPDQPDRHRQADGEEERVVISSPPKAPAASRGVAVSTDRRRKSRRSSRAAAGRSSSRSRSRSRGKSPSTPNRARARDLIRDASQRLHAAPKSPGGLHATASAAAAAVAAAAADSLRGGSAAGGGSGGGRPLSSKGRPVTLPNSASSRHLSRDGSRSAFSKSSKSSRSPSPSDSERSDFGAEPLDEVNSLRTHTLPVHETPASPGLLEFRRHSCISPQAPNLAPPEKRNPRSKTTKLATIEPEPGAAPPPPPPGKPHAAAWS